MSFLSLTTFSLENARPTTEHDNLGFDSNPSKAPIEGVHFSRGALCLATVSISHVPPLPEQEPPRKAMRKLYSLYQGLVLQEGTALPTTDSPCSSKPKALTSTQTPPVRMLVHPLELKLIQSMQKVRTPKALCKGKFAGPALDSTCPPRANRHRSGNAFRKK